MLLPKAKEHHESLIEYEILRDNLYIAITYNPQ